MKQEEIEEKAKQIHYEWGQRYHARTGQMIDPWDTLPEVYKEHYRQEAQEKWHCPDCDCTISDEETYEITERMDDED